VPRLLVTTQFGRFAIALAVREAPLTCAYFCDLVRRGTLDNAAIFRVVAAANHAASDACPIHVVQLGPIPAFEGTRHAIAHESTNLTGLRHRRWTVSAARFDLDELYGSFFICMRDEPELDFGGRRQPDGQGFAAFGSVVAGFEVVEAAYARAECSELLAIPIPVTRIVIEDSTA
jgi:peptidyl-prolyl cis-trans isomerase A (cyclophilin A)